MLVGVCGPQGSGKSTLCDALRTDLAEQGCPAAVLSIDDVYLTRAERLDLARKVHPLLATRGPPGTHDLGLLTQVLDDLTAERSLALPRFDKAADDRAPARDWPRFDGPAGIVLLEGWCVGARPQPPEALEPPVNALEREEDQDGRWRRYVNDALAAYQPAFGRIDLLIQLRPPSFETAPAWRRQQEVELRASRTGAGVMSDPAIARFVQHYERLTRYIMDEMPSRADILVQLGAGREIVSVSGSAS